MPSHQTVYGLSLLLLLSTPALSQQVLYGHVRKRKSDEVLSAVTVRNISRQKNNRSDMGGNYRIEAQKGDTLVFTSAGYLPDTTIVNTWMFTEANGYSVYLKPNLVALPAYTVEESSNYRQDSLARLEAYGWINDPNKVHREKLAGGKRFSDGVGISLSPIAYFRRKEAQRRKFRKKLKSEEKEYYIDYRFPRAYVSHTTGLQGDSLQTFMIHFRPSYEFCRASSQEDMLNYINDSMKKFKRGGITILTLKDSSSSVPTPHGWLPARSGPYIVWKGSDWPYSSCMRRRSRIHSGIDEIDSIRSGAKSSDPYPSCIRPSHEYPVQAPSDCRIVLYS